MAASSRLGVLMKLDKNQRKPRVFKASDLCPYYNRRVHSSDNACCFHGISFSFYISKSLPLEGKVAERQRGRMRCRCAAALEP